MNKSIYRVIYSDIKGKAISHLPITYKVKFFSFERAMRMAKRFHSENRDVVVIESDNEGMISSWELNTEYYGLIFDYNEERNEIIS